MTLKKTSQSMMRLSVKIAIYVIFIGGLLLAARGSYQFGREIFSDKGKDKTPGTDVTVTVKAGESQLALAKDLAGKGVVKNAYVFFIQLKLYKPDRKGAKIAPGEYVLNSSKSGEELAESLYTPATEEGS